MYPDPHDDLCAHRDWLLSFVDLPKGGTVVDLGCGNGDDLLTLAARHPDPAARFLGIDAAKGAISVATARAAGDVRVSFIRHRLGEQVPLTDASVDAVYSHNLLECLGDRAASGGRSRPPGCSTVPCTRGFSRTPFTPRPGTATPACRTSVAW